MNSGISAVGMALNLQFERGASGLKLEAHQDTAGNWQIGDGITVLPDGRKVTPGMVLTDMEYASIAPAKMGEYEDAVRRLVDPKITLNQYQFDALVLLAYNIGVGALRTSSVLENVNAGRFSDAAFHFGDWVYARIESRKDPKTGKIEWAQDPNGNPLPLGVRWYKAYRGLYRRHRAESCLLLGYDWREACHEDRIELKATPVWEPAKNRWKDRIDYVTPWEDILRIARKTPLPPLEHADPTPDTPMTTEDLNYIQYVKLGGKKPFREFSMTPEKLKQVKPHYTPKPVEEAGSVDMKETSRFKGEHKRQTGIDMQKASAVAGGASVALTVSNEVASKTQKLSDTILGSPLLMWGSAALLGFAAVYVLIGWFLRWYGASERFNGEAGASQYMH